jgi:hypothetical protein
MYPVPLANHSLNYPLLHYQSLKKSVEINGILRDQNGLSQAKLGNSSNAKNSTINIKRTSRKRTCLNIHL